MIKVIIIFLVFNLLAFEDNEKKQEITRFFWDKKVSILDINLHFYIRNLAKKIDNNNYDFFILNDTKVNAFATEYGLIGINKGLINLTSSESELAAVIAHEIAHIKLKHFKRFEKKTANNKLLLIGGILLAGLSKNSEVGQALTFGSLAGNTQMQINFTREHEIEADNYGEKLLKKSVFDNNSMSSFFAKLKENKNALEFLRTHPLSKNRVVNSFIIKNQIKHLDSFEYLITKAKLNSKADIIIDNKEVASYIKAWNYFNADNYKQAIESLKEFDNFSINLLKARSLAHLGKLSKAVFYLKGDDELSKYYLAKSYFINKKYKQALAVIKTQNYKKPNVYNYILIAEIYLTIGNNDKFHYNQGNALLLMDKVQKAKKQFILAKNITQNKDLLSVLEYKIKNLVK